VSIWDYLSGEQNIPMMIVCELVGLIKILESEFDRLRSVESFSK